MPCQFPAPQQSWGGFQCIISDGDQSVLQQIHCQFAAKEDAATDPGGGLGPAASAVGALHPALLPLSPADNVCSDLGIWQEN